MPLQLLADTRAVMPRDCGITSPLVPLCLVTALVLRAVGSHPGQQTTVVLTLSRPR